MSEATVNGIKFTDADVINKDDFIPAGEYNPHNVRPWLLHEHGFVLAVVFAESLQDALDEAADAGKLDSFKLDSSSPINQDDYMEIQTEEKGFSVERNGKVVWMDWLGSVSFFGNACEAFDIELVDYVEMKNPPFSFAAIWAATIDAN
jgi:hypothetical protein